MFYLIIPYVAPKPRYTDMLQNIMMTVNLLDNKAITFFDIINDIIGDKLLSKKVEIYEKEQ